MEPEPQHLTIAVEGGDPTALVLEGELDPHSAPQMEAAVAAAVDRGARRVDLDLSGVRFIDSSGLRALLAARTVPVDGLRLRRPSSGVIRVLEITGVADRFEIIPNH